MCGIAGIMTVDGNSPSKALLEKMGSYLQHRGPDGREFFTLHGVGMVHNRLAIIDLESGKQPFFGTTKQIKESSALIANAEIYNYIEVKNDIGQEFFSTNSDCEVPIILYGLNGLEMNKALRGMYAIAIYDPSKKQLILMRDPFGIKPLYFCENSNGFAFASEPGALIEAGLASTSLRRKVRDEFLQLQFTTGRDTIYEDIYRLLPGETIVVQNGKIKKKCRLAALSSQSPVPITLSNALENLETILQNSIEIHQRSDVPYGMFFSGGVDSSVLLEVMSSLNDTPVEAFTVGFSGTMAHDEREHARAIVRRLGANHHEIEFCSHDFWNLLPKIISYLDDPVADYAVLPTYKLAGVAKDMGLKVILTGEGGDEIFAGYSRYRRARRSWFFGGRVMRHRGILHGLGLLRTFPTKWRVGLSEIEEEKEKLNLTPIQRVQAIDIEGWLPNDLLLKLDRCLMAHGIEGRVPFLDLKLANFAFQLPDKLKIKGSQGKWLLRNWLDDKIKEAKPFSRKRGFQVPIGEWVQPHGDRLGPLVAKQAGIAEICDPLEVSRLFSSSGKEVIKAQWILLFYALWHQNHIIDAKVDGSIFDVLA